MRGGAPLLPGRGQGHRQCKGPGALPAWLEEQQEAVHLGVVSEGDTDRDWLWSQAVL